VQPIDPSLGNPIPVVAEPSAEALRNVKQLVDYDLLPFRSLEIVETFRDDLNRVVGFHSKAFLPNPRERMHASDGASRL